MIRLRRKVAELEARVVDLEARLNMPNWEMPPAPAIDMDPSPGIAAAFTLCPVPPYVIADEDETRRGYL